MFAKKIADLLIVYLDKTNTSKLPEGYQFGQDNEALLKGAEKSVGHVAMQGINIASSLLSAGISQGMAYWSSKPPTQSSPKTSPGSSVGSSSDEKNTSLIPKHHGPVGIDRALKLAQIFGLTDVLGQGESIVTILKQSGEGRSSDLFGELGFNLLPPNIVKVDFTQEDCIHICQFALSVVQQPDFAHSKLVQSVIAFILKEVDIQPHEIEEERSRLKNARESSSQSPAIIPDILCKPEYAELKLMFQWAFLKAKILPSDKNKDLAGSVSTIVSRMYIKSKSSQSANGQGSALSSSSSSSGASSVRSTRSSVSGSARSAQQNNSSTTLSPVPLDNKEKDGELQFKFD